MNSDRPVLALCFLNFGPYHCARLQSARALIDRFSVCGIEMTRHASEYDWKPANESDSLHTVESTATPERLTRVAWLEKVGGVLDRIQPDCCAVAGYSNPTMLAVIEWCRQHGRPIILMSDSTEWDARRTRIKEWFKKNIVAQCSAGFVAGEPHAHYLSTLGMPHDRITIGYDVVDNDHFSRGVVEACVRAEETRQQLRLPARYFLASSRFVEKKNLPRLMHAYALYRSRCESKSANDAWDFVILGDGGLRCKLESLRASLGLTDHVQLPGFKQYEVLPQYFGLAEAFIHASTIEQWGLVVNEAMAASLPVLVSEMCGCTSTLVKDTENGFVFNPLDVHDIAEQMWKMHALSPESRRAMGKCGAQRVAKFGLDRFAEGLAGAADIALRNGPAVVRPIHSLTLRALKFVAR